jgi:hypothetical protein
MGKKFFDLRFFYLHLIGIIDALVSRAGMVMAAAALHPVGGGFKDFYGLCFDVILLFSKRSNFYNLLREAFIGKNDFALA